MNELRACERFRAAASAAFDGERPLDERSRAHAFTCPECRAFQAGIEGLRVQLAPLARVAVPDLWPRIAARAPAPRRPVPVLWRVAALLLGLAGTLATLWATERACAPRRTLAHAHTPWASLAPLREPLEDIRRAEDRPEMQLLALLTMPIEDER